MLKLHFINVGDGDAALVEDFLYEKRKDAFNGRGIPYNIKDVIAFFIYKIVFGFLKVK